MEAEARKARFWTKEESSAAETEAESAKRPLRREMREYILSECASYAEKVLEGHCCAERARAEGEE